MQRDTQSGGDRLEGGGIIQGKSGNDDHQQDCQRCPMKQPLDSVKRGQILRGLRLWRFGHGRWRYGTTCPVQDQPNAEECHDAIRNYLGRSVRQVFSLLPTRCARRWETYSVAPPSLRMAVPMEGCVELLLASRCTEVADSPLVF